MTVRWRRAVHVSIAVALLGSLTTSGVGATASTPTFPGSLPATASAVTVHGRGEFAGLDVTVNQTKDLTTQAISLAWNWAGRSTTFAPATGDGVRQNNYRTDYLQVMQCWGDPVTSAGSDAATAANYVADDPGPAREQCEFGSTSGVDPNPLTNVVGLNAASRYVNSCNGRTPTAPGECPADVTPRHLGDDSVYSRPWATVNPGSFGTPDIPFRAADGTVVPHVTSPLAALPGSTYHQYVYANTFYDQTTTNESVANRTWTDSSGGTAFQVQNALNAPGLGCGAARAAGGGSNRCWLVIVPRGEQDLDGSTIPVKNGPFSQNTVAYASPLASTVWKDRIAIPLDFRSVQSSCATGAAEVSTSGSELVAQAMLSWQAKLCSTDGTVYGYAATDDSLARSSLAGGSDALAYTSQPVTADSLTTPVTYAPVALSGVTLSFVWDQATDTRKVTGIAGKPLPQIDLTPRLVAKLLTYSYVQANPYRVQGSAADADPPQSAYGWLAHNPLSLSADPDFIAQNPALTGLAQGGDPLSTVQVEFNGSDAAARLWAWIAADPEAAAWLVGRPDPWGMQVDPYYSTSAAVNPSGAPFDPTSLRTFPNSDPWQGQPGYDKPVTYGNPVQTAPDLTMIDMRPYSTGLEVSAHNVLVNNTLDRHSLGFDTTATPPGWKGPSLGPVVPGNRSLMAFTDSADSARYGLVDASLRNAAGKFVAPTTAGITAAAGHLVSTGADGVAQPDLASSDEAAYPLSTLVYAAVTTNTLNVAQCAAYAGLLDYIAGPGQEPGQQIGDLPPGYVPLPAALRQQTVDAARTVAACAKDPVPAATGDDAPPSSPSQDGSTSSFATTVGPAADVPVEPVTTALPPGSVSLSASVRGTTGVDPAVFGYAVPIALGLGLLSLMVAPALRYRRR